MLYFVSEQRSGDVAVKIELPADVEAQLEKQWGDLPRHALENLAVEGYRARVLSRPQVRRMLGFETSAEVDEFMRRAGVTFDYTLEDFQSDARTSEYLKQMRGKELPER
jgi:Uncharacterised protein family (UPF0175)